MSTVNRWWMFALVAGLSLGTAHADTLVERKAAREREKREQREKDEAAKRDKEAAAKKQQAALDATKAKWCAQMKPSKDDVPFMRGDPDTRPTTYDMIRFERGMCSYPAHEQLKGWVTKMRANYQSFVGVTPAEYAEIMALGMQAMSMEFEPKQICNAVFFNGKASRLDIELKRLWWLEFECYGDHPPLFLFSEAAPGIAWHLDFPDQKPLQIELVDEILLSAGKTVVHESAWPVIGNDVALLDRKAFDAELAGLKLIPLGQAMAIGSFYNARARAAQIQKKLETSAAAGDVQAKELLEIPARAKAEWDKLYAANKDDLDAAFAVEKKLFALDPNEIGKLNKIGACDDLRKRFRTYVASKKPKNMTDFLAAAHDPVGYDLLSATAACDAAELHPVDEALEYAILSKGNGSRQHGMRFIALKMAFDVAAKLEAEAKKTNRPPAFRASDFIKPIPQISWKPSGFLLSTPWDMDNSDLSGTHRSTVEARVKSMKKTDDGVVVTFKPEKWMEADWTCKPNGRINWDPNGKPYQEQDCTVTGHHEESITMREIIVTEDTASLLKPDQWVRFMATQVSEGSHGAVIFGGTHVGADTKWTSMFGVPFAK